MKKIIVLVLVVIFSLGISVLAAVLSTKFLDAPWQLVIGIFTFSLCAVFVVKSSIEEVKETWNVVTELFGQYERILGPGIHFLWPFCEKAVSRVYMGEEMMDLNLVKFDADNKVIDGLEFKDCSEIGVKACLYYQIVDAKAATYNISDLLGAISEKAESVLRGNLVIYNLDDAMSFRDKFTKEIIACFTNLVPDQTTPPTPVAMPTQAEYEASEFYLSLMRLGVMPQQFSIAKYYLPEKIIAQREKKLNMDTEIKVAELELKKAKVIQKAEVVKAQTEEKTTVIKARGKSRAQELVGVGDAKKITSILTAADLQAGQSAGVIAELAKWDAISNSKSNEKVILLEGKSEVANGAAFGVGAHATNPPANPPANTPHP